MAENFCSNCGKPLLQDDKFCSACGESTVRTETEAPEAPEAPTTPYYDPRPDRKDPITAAFASTIIVGVGQFYVGKWWRGIGFMALEILFFWLTWPTGFGVIVALILAPIDAYDQATKHNIKYGYSKEEHVEKWGYLRDRAIPFGGIFFMFGLIGLAVVLVEGLFIWIFIPIIFIVLGIESLYLNLTKFR